MKGVSPNLILLCLAFILGTALGLVFDLEIISLSIATAALFLIMLIFFWRSEKIDQPDYFFISSTGLFFICCGMLNSTLSTPLKQANHFEHLASGENRFIQVKLTENLGLSKFSQRFYGRVTYVDKHTAEGKVLVNFKQVDRSVTFKTGDLVLVNSIISTIAPPKNPYQFDYGNYLKKQDILGQIRVSNTQVKKLGESKLKPWQDNHSFYTQITSSLKESGFTDTQVALINALLLGQKKNLSSETYQSFTQAGLVHTLAVSGLHVGLLLGIFSILLYPLRRLPYGDILHTVLSVFMLWCYAALVGFSPSIIRAVTMFSLFSIGVGLRQKANTLNMLALSAVILLLYDAKFIEQIGFQLSYAAVLSIVLFQPKLYSLWRPKYRIIRFFWGISIVSMCAQLGILPLSLYYFHQFTGLFLISNLLIIPGLSLLLGGGILAIVLSLLRAAPQAYVDFYGFFLNSLNDFVRFMARNEAFIFEDIYFSKAMLITAMIAIFGTGSALYLRKKWVWIAALTSVLGFQGIYIWQYAQHHQKQQFVVFHQPLNSVLGHLEKGTWQMYTDMSKDSLNHLYWAQNLEQESAAKISEVDTLLNLYAFNGQMLWIPGEGWKEVDPAVMDPKIVVLQHSPKLNLERFLTRFHPKIIIADGSNYYSSIEKWAKTCREFDIEFHATKDDGAFILNTSKQP